MLELRELFDIQTCFQPMNLMHWFQVPRTIVNVVQILRMKPLREVQRPTLGCQLQKSPECFLLLFLSLSNLR